ncbi:MAG: TldD/PmbA family protein [Thermoplasmata archaeon]|nr:TldD/PmbA family protein [Thermoplasmata archaeon]
MSVGTDAAFTAFHVADRVRAKAASPWEVFGERVRRYEVHLNGPRVEMVRAPIEVEGFALRLFRRADDQTGVGVAAGTSMGDTAVLAAIEQAEALAAFARFPARRIDLPGTAGHAASVEVVDRETWEHPVEAMHRVADALLRPLEGKPGIVPSFGSVRLTLYDTTLSNSEGLHRRYSHTSMEYEFAIKSSGGPEGAPPGEHWVNARMRRLPTDGEIARDAERWCELARDVRSAKSPTTGPTRVVLPPSVLADILPAIVGYRMSGTAQLRKMAPDAGSTVGSPQVTVTDDGLLPFGIGTAPCDDEGTSQSRRPLIEGGVARGTLQDLLHASALGEGATGNGRRDSTLFPSWFHFGDAVSALPTTLVLAPGQGGSDEELLEACGDGIWVDQLGYAFPDPVSGAFGGELRSAYRIRNGKKAEPVRGGTLGGVVFAPSGVPSLLTSIEAVGGRPMLVGALYAPSVLVQGMTIAGG